MTAPWWASRDRDLGTEPGSKYLGTRDWNWFTPYPNGASPHDTDNATTPWAGHPVLPTDGNDRTLGIPDRTISMWPKYTTPQPQDDELALTFHQHTATTDALTLHREKVTAIIRDLTTTIPPRPGPPDISPALLTDLLSELAPLVFARSPSQQRAEISTLARTNDIPAATLTTLARQTATLIARNTQQPAPTRPGDPALNRLLHADLRLATTLLYARTTLATARAYSDPDLPRLWILANALHHTIPATILTTQPATSHGPAATLIPTHHDLVHWPGIRTAIEHLHATAEAANQGRHWITTLTTGASTTDRILALGIIQLTHPRTAYELALAGNTNLDLTALRHLASTLPTARIENLSDAALKAVCDRNHWLLGTPDERTQRELVERHITTALTTDVRTRLAHGDTTALTHALTHHSPTDPALDHATWQQSPPHHDAQQRHELLDHASSHAIHRFHGLEIHPHPTKTAAFAARFPDRLAEKGLKTSPDALLNHPGPDLPPAALGTDPSQLDIPGL